MVRKSENFCKKLPTHHQLPTGNRNALLLCLLLCCLSCQSTYRVLPAYETIEFAERPKNIILFIGDGMSIAQISAAMYASKDPQYIEAMPVVGLHKTHSSNDLITDSAASATAFATGKKTYNNAVGVDTDTLPLYTIAEEARDRGYATGLVTTVPITHATPAAFFAHQPNRVFSEKIALDLAASGADLLIGGGKKFFDRRKDDRNLLAEMQKKGYRTENYLNRNLDEIALGNEDKLIYLTADSSPLGVGEGRDYLPFAAKFSPRFLERRSEKGFFLMIEAGQIDWAGHAKDGRRVLSEMKDFNLALGNVLRYAAENKETLVIVTADHETGGLALNKNGKSRKPKLEFTTNGHTAQMTTLFAYGPGAQYFSGIYDNTAVYRKMQKAWGWK